MGDVNKLVGDMNELLLSYFSAKLKCLFALTVTPRGVVTLEVVLRKGQRLLDRGPYTGACTEAALAPHATAAHRTAPPSPAVTGRGAYDASSRRAAARSAARVECAFFSQAQVFVRFNSCK